jgi:tetratricopeptide (TPR) repeat protein
MKALVVAFALALTSATAFAQEGTSEAPEAPVVVDKAAARAKDKEGMSLLKTDAYAAAEALAQAVALDPGKAAYHNHYGLALLKSFDYYSAAEEFKAAIERGLSTDYVWNNLGMAYEHMDQLDDARDAYRKAGQKGSPYAPLHLKRLEGVKSVYPRELGCGG